LAGGEISWVSKKQPVITLSTTEAEFIATALCACHCVWLRRILEHLDQCQFGTTVIFCDNGSTIKLSKNPVLHGRSKHIDVRFYFLRILCNDGVVELFPQDMVGVSSQSHSQIRKYVRGVRLCLR